MLASPRPPDGAGLSLSLLCGPAAQGGGEGLLSPSMRGSGHPAPDLLIGVSPRPCREQRGRSRGSELRMGTHAGSLDRQRLLHHISGDDVVRGSREHGSRFP